MSDPVHMGVRPATPDDKLPFVLTLSAAFCAGPLAQWLVPDAEFRQFVYVEYSRAVYDHALAHGHVITAGSNAGGAVWYPYPGDGPSAGDDKLAVVLGAAAGLFHQLDEAMAPHVPPEPHHHLAFLGVHPDRQRRGIGSALLRHHHRVLDATRTPAFLVATSPGSRDLYDRHGYSLREEFTLPDGPPLWAMWREPPRC